MKMLEIEHKLNVDRHSNDGLHWDFKPDKNNNGGLIAWSMVDDLLHLILINAKTYIYLIADNPECDFLRLVYSNKLGKTRAGVDFQSVQILLPHESSEQEIYNNSSISDTEAYADIERDNWSRDYGNEDFEWGGLSDEEGEIGYWNCD